ncbi:MAG: 4-hydroxythreonine-4-phosphate dehydrogenase PdxA [Methylococcaceae bacterium]|nr:4-hydroxythreonine-4-phosphate dehydrogenase PdxA [Methylococcaceae bacterium]
MNDRNLGAFPRILLTAGEPAGIGPDLCVLIAQRAFPCELTVAGDPNLLMARAQQLGVGLKLVEAGESMGLHQPGSLKLLSVDCPVSPVCGELNLDNANYVLETIATGTRACLDGRFDALVTAPVHKGVINQAGVAFTGHTEYIAEFAGGHPVMMLTTEGLKVALATTHLPLKEVSAAITPERLSAVIRILHDDLIRRFAIAQPHILVCGLNPHAGEDGHLGREELDVIEPVLNSFRHEGMRLTGPLPADTLFLPKNLQRADAVLAMYHDQGLPVLKYRGFGKAVNITLGLSIIRTSVDHGTALDLAGTGRIDTGSLEAAIGMAIAMSLNSVGSHP